MKKYFYSLISLLFLTGNILAQKNLFSNNETPPLVTKANLSGRVTDAKNNQPLSGATIFINDVKSGCATDANGFFQIKNIPEGSHLVEVSHIGYGSIAENIFITGDTKKDFALTESAVENNAVVVTGVTKATQIKKIPFQVSLIKKEELAQNAGSNIIEALTKKSGISSVSTGPAISKPVIRGLGYNRVLTINDGVRQEGQQWGDEHGIEIDEASVNKIEILKGPASLIYGSDAMAGVINIITNTPVPVNTLKANFGTNYQSNNRLQAFNASIGANSNGFNWNFYSSSKKAHDYRNKYDDYVFNSKFRENNVGGYAGYNGGWGYSHLLFSNYDLKTGLVEGERDDEGYFIKPVAGGGETRATENDFKSFTPTVPYQRIRHFKTAIDNSLRIGKNRLSLNVGWQLNKREEFGNIDDLNERSLFFDLKTLTYTTQFHLKEINGWKTSIGANGMHQQNKNLGVEQLIPDYTMNDIGAYVYAQKEIKKITFSGGARFDNRTFDAGDLLDGASVKSDGFKKTFSNFSGSLGMAAQLTDVLNIKLNVARAFRAPTAAELGSNGNHEGTLRYEYGNINLKSETSLQFDGGLDFNTDHISVSVSGFYNSFSNFIFYRKLEAAAGGDSTININGDDLTAFIFDQRKATLSGVEATLDFHPHPLDWLHIQNTFSVTNGRFKKQVESTRFMPFIPAARLLTEIKASFAKAADNIRNFYLKLELDNTFAQDNVFTAYNTETKTAGYFLLNAGAGMDITSNKGNTIVSINFIANNLADAAYQNHLSRLKYSAENMATGRTGVFNMGQNFSIKINVPLTIALNQKSN